MGKPETPEAIKERAIALYLKSGKMTATARECGISAPTLYKILYTNGVPRGYALDLERARRKRLTVEQEAVVVEKHKSGVDAEALAAEFGCSSWVIAKTIRAAGLRPHRRGGKYKVLSESESAEAVRLYLEGHSQMGVAAILGSSQPVIGRTLHKAGAKVRRANARGEDHGSWKGGVSRNGEGYVLSYVDMSDPLASMRAKAGYVLQHRLVMARALGRPLSRHESVHHINGVRDDNRLENLQLRHGKHGKGIVLRCAHCGSADVAAVELP